MWKEETKTGVRYVERYRDPITGRMKKISKSYPKHTKQNEKQAQIYLIDKVRRLARSDLHQDLKLHDALDLLIDDKRPRVRKSTFINFTSMAKRLYQLPNVSLTSVDRAFVKRYITPLPRGAKVAWNGLSNYLRKEELTPKALPKSSLDRREKSRMDNTKLVDIEQLKALRTAPLTVGQHVKRCLFEFCLCTGLRYGEASALLFSDITDDVITINKSYSQTLLAVTEPKTDHSYRRIPVTDEIKHLLHEYMPYREALMQRASYKEQNIVFPSNAGGHIPISNMSTFLKKFVGKDCSTHNARHTYATRMLENGVAMETVARLLGHASTQLLADTYGHVTKQVEALDFLRAKSVKIT